MQKLKQKIMQNKKSFSIFAVALFAVALVSAAVVYNSITVDATVSEALSTTTVSLDFSGFPGETITHSIDIQNDASVNLDTTLSWTELTNVNGATYSTDLSKTVTLTPGANSVDVSVTYNTDSPVGDITAEITLERI